MVCVSAMGVAARRLSGGMGGREMALMTHLSEPAAPVEGSRKNRDVRIGV
jgi:hypothetical protein